MRVICASKLLFSVKAACCDTLCVVVTRGAFCVTGVAVSVAGICAAVGSRARWKSVDDCGCDAVVCGAVKATGALLVVAVCAVAVMRLDCSAGDACGAAETRAGAFCCKTGCAVVPV